MHTIKRRHAKILELIDKMEISTQSELANHLSAAGFNVTQATVSRDIKILQLVKVVSESGASIYSQSEKTVQNEFSEKLQEIFFNSVISITPAGNMVVVKTLSGAAHAAASAIDSADFSEIIGCIAGDDTIMIVTKSEKDSEDICSKLWEMGR